MKWRAWHGGVLLAVLLLPLFVVCVRNTHDWGDDFAQYIVQARDLSHGDLIRPDHAVLNWPAGGPAPKGIGYSVLLVPLYALFSVGVAPYLMLNVVAVMFAALLLFRCVNASHGATVAFIGALLFAYDRHVLQACTEIMPDVLLTLCVVLCVWSLDRTSSVQWWWAMAAVVFALLLKAAGWLLWIVLCWALVRAFWKRDVHRPSLRILPCGVLLPPLVGIVLPLLLSRSAFDIGFWYADLLDAGTVLQRIGDNAVVYAGHAAHYFEQELPMWMNRLLVPVVLLVAVIGLLLRCVRGVGVRELLLLLWIIMLLVYPDTNSATRFMLPLLPIMVLYIVEGGAWVVERLKLPPVVLPMALGAFLLAHALSVHRFAQHDRTLGMGPYTRSAQAAFEAVKRIVPADSPVASTRPWALHLFTGRTAMWAPSPTDLGRPVPQVADIEPAFILLANSKEEAGMFDEGLREHVVNDRTWVEVWRNDRFTLVQRQNAAQ